MSDDQRSWWDFDPDERPIPLAARAEAVANEAEEIVESQRQAIMRQDTDPTGETLAALRESAAPTPRLAIHLRPSSVTRVALALLAAGCVVMFGLGWMQGSEERAEARGPAGERVTGATNKDAPAASNQGLGATSRIGRTNKEVSAS